MRENIVDCFESDGRICEALFVIDCGSTDDTVGLQKTDADFIS